MNDFVRKAVMFNLADAHQRQIYEWCVGQSGNFSGFVKDILFAYKNGAKSEVSRPQIVPPESQFDDRAGISDIL